MNLYQAYYNYALSNTASPCWKKYKGDPRYIMGKLKKRYHITPKARIIMSRSDNVLIGEIIPWKLDSPDIQFAYDMKTNTMMSFPF